MASTKINKERAARILVDAIVMGDKTAADRHKVAEKTVQRYRARMREDEELSALVRQKGREAEYTWHFARARFLRNTLDKLDEMVKAATVADMPNVIEALKAAGELDLATEALGVGSRSRQPSPSPAEDADEGQTEEGG